MPFADFYKEKEDVNVVVKDGKHLPLSEYFVFAFNIAISINERLNENQ